MLLFVLEESGFGNGALCLFEDRVTYASTRSTGLRIAEAAAHMAAHVSVPLGLLL